MTATASPIGKPEAHRLPLSRFAVYAPVALSAAFIVLDAAGGGVDSRRPDTGIELIGRVLMLIVAVLAARKTGGDRRLGLLLWGVVLLSFDTYWQTTYRNFGGKPLELIELVVKYLATGVGLGLLLRFCATFGDDSGDRFRRWIATWSLAIGSALAAVGLLHGVLYVQSCYFFSHGDECIISQPAALALNAYLVADALVRLAIVVAAVRSYVCSSPDHSQRTLLVSAASFLFALGTFVDFVARLNLPYDAVLALQFFDAVTTVLFPLGLLYAATHRQLFDVEYVVKRSAVVTITTSCIVAAWAIAITAAELFFHHRALHGVVIAAHQLGEFLKLDVLRHVEEGQLDYAVGIPFLLLWKPLESRLDKPVEQVVLRPERPRQRDRLRSLIDRIAFVSNRTELEHLLLKALRKGIRSTFADIFVRDEAGGFKAYLSSRDPQPAYLNETQPPIPRLARRKHICLKCRHEDLPNYELMVRMMAGGKYIGVLVCGPPSNGEIPHFAPDTIEEIELFASMAASALFNYRDSLTSRIRKEIP